MKLAKDQMDAKKNALIKTITFFKHDSTYKKVQSFYLLFPKCMSFLEINRKRLNVKFMNNNSKFVSNFCKRQKKTF